MLRKILLLTSITFVIFVSGCTTQTQYGTEEYCHKFTYNDCPTACVVGPSCPVCEDIGCHAKNAHLPPSTTVKATTTSIAQVTTTLKTTTTIQMTTTTQVKVFTLEADDLGFYPDGTVTVNKGDNVEIEFVVRTSGTYYGGLDFRSSIWGDTGTVKPGEAKTVQFIANDSFIFTSYWPVSNVKKTDGHVVVV